MVAIAGNATICIIPMRRKRMRTCTYILITNLAVSDIGTMLCLPYIILAEWQENEWTLGEVMCRLVNPSLTMFYIVTTNTLVAIAAHRFFVLVFPFRSKPSKNQDCPRCPSDLARCVSLRVTFIWCPGVEFFRDETKR